MSSIVARRGAATSVLVVVLVLSLAALARERRRPIPREIVDAIKAHEELARRAKASPEAACELVADTFALDTRISRAVRFEDQERLRVTGRLLVETEEFSWVGIDYTELAKRVPSADVPLLRAMGVMEGTWKAIENVPAWQEAMTDYGGCHAPARAAAALADLVKSWAGARPCLRDAVKAALEESLEDMARDENFCQEPRPKRLAAVRKNAALMRKLEGTRGPELADQLERSAEQSTDRPPHVPG